MKFVIERLQEASTWRGFILLLTSLGVGIAPEMITPIVTAGTGLAGLVGIFSKD